jgi:hypothetical protein
LGAVIKNDGRSCAKQLFQKRGEQTTTRFNGLDEVCVFIYYESRVFMVWCKGECASSVRVGKKDSDVINYSGAQQEAASGILKLKSLMTANSTPQTTCRGGV